MMAEHLSRFLADSSVGPGPAMELWEVWVKGLEEEAKRMRRGLVPPGSLSWGAVPMRLKGRDPPSRIDAILNRVTRNMDKRWDSPAGKGVVSERRLDVDDGPAKKKQKAADAKARKEKEAAARAAAGEEWRAGGDTERKRTTQPNLGLKGPGQKSSIPQVARLDRSVLHPANDGCKKVMGQLRKVCGSDNVCLHWFLAQDGCKRQECQYPHFLPALAATEWPKIASCLNPKAPRDYKLAASDVAK